MIRCSKCAKRLSQRRKTGLCRICWHKDKKLNGIPDSQKKNISKKMKGRIPKHMEALIKASPFQKGHKDMVPQDARDRAGKKISKILKALYKNPENHPCWRGKNASSKEYKRLWSHKRRVRIRGNSGEFTIGEWELLKKQYGFTCPCCGRNEPEIQLTIDHIIPVVKGGSNYIENIQPLCRSCNSKKNIKIIKYENCCKKDISLRR